MDVKTDKTKTDIMLDLAKQIGSFISPIIYLFVWYLFINFSLSNIPIPESQLPIFLVLSFLFFSLGLITNATSWSIGHEKFGLKGDSRSRVINFHRNEAGDSWFDLFADNPELLNNENIRSFIKDLSSPINKE